MEVKIKTLTPIWTGGAGRRGETLRETGIIGSLRWWYEALIRGLGGYACDPTSDKRCELSGKEKSDEVRYKKLCPACWLFGCGGWSRKFKLEVKIEGKKKDLINLSIGARRTNRAKRPFSGIAADSHISLTFTPLKEIAAEEWTLLSETLKIISEHGALGARISQGNGVIKIVENDLFAEDNKISSRKFGLKESKARSNNKNWPNLLDFFFWKFNVVFKEEIVQLLKEKAFWTHAQEDSSFHNNWHQWEKAWTDYAILPVAFHVRDTLRPVVTDKGNRHDLFGERGKGSKIFLSHGYKKDENNKAIEFRVFGYGVPDHIQDVLKKTVLNQLKEKLFASNSDNFIEQVRYSSATTGKEIIDKLKKRLEVPGKSGS